jgi:hypothetical protein
MRDLLGYVILVSILAVFGWAYALTVGDPPRLSMRSKALALMQSYWGIIALFMGVSLFVAGAGAFVRGWR